MEKYGKLNGKRVELTQEFIDSTPVTELAQVVVTLPTGDEIRPFRFCGESADQQIGRIG